MRDENEKKNSNAIFTLMHLSSLDIRQNLLTTVQILSAICLQKIFLITWTYCLINRHCHRRTFLFDDADLTVTTAKKALLYLLQGNTEEFAKVSQMEGDASVLEKLANNLTEERTKLFNFIEP